ncbi:HEAT repeat domain-containing protein [Prochlorococcus sp. MIT 1300]|uniref:HEAT repeat domain-containing protein n=1 Tax=Prochlorococcus sp. MIT 1300 TaxID=3096218 RepID=UPI002A75112C|nr:HEAT repeat domain-containing protein [Prochlorococcus sp. MIT 1300]
MTGIESEIWERLCNTKIIPIEVTWLADKYSPTLSKELKIAICEQLGMKSQEGWKAIKNLIKKYGKQPELILASGLCHQDEAKELLLNTIKEEDGKFNITTIRALNCWGAELPISLLKQILESLEQEIRLAGIDLLKFKLHTLSEKEILELTKNLLIDIRDPILVATIRVLQRRDEESISEKLRILVEEGSDVVAKSALIALGSIGTHKSYEILTCLFKTLPPGIKRDLTNKQLKSQYRFANT